MLNSYAKWLNLTETIFIRKSWVLLLVVFGAWLLCDYYREQAQETVIYKQAQEVSRERNYYYSQIQDYKRNNSKYARLFPAYNDKGFWDQFNKP